MTGIPSIYAIIAYTIYIQAIFKIRRISLDFAFHLDDEISHFIIQLDVTIVLFASTIPLLHKYERMGGFSLNIFIKCYIARKVAAEHYKNQRTLIPLP